MPHSEQPNLPMGKPPTPAERAARDFAVQLAHPCRFDEETGATLYYHGWGFAGGATGHVVRRWNADLGSWSAPFTVRATVIRKSAPTELPTGAEKPEEPKK